MNRRYVLLSAIFVTALAVINSTRLSSNSAHVAAGYVNDPVFSRTCANAGCHAGGVNLSAITNLTLEIADSADYANSNLHSFTSFQYLPNTTYWIVFSIQQPLTASNYNGFQMTAIDSATDSMAGVFTRIDTFNTFISTPANPNRQYMGHKNADTTATWTYKWTSSQDTGEVQFYYNYLTASTSNGAANPQTWEGAVSITSALSTALPHVSLGNNQTVTQFGAVIELRTTTFGGTAPYTYMWHTNPNVTNPLGCTYPYCDSTDMTVTTTTNVNVTVTDAINHTASASVNIILDTTPLPAQALCMVTCDSVTSENMVVWPPAGGADSFFIYRSDSGAGFLQIAALPGSNAGVYYDVSAQPGNMSYQYEINLKDTSGLYDSLSPAIQTIYLQYLGTGVLQWTPYKVGADSSISNLYDIYRDSLGNGNWLPLAAVSTAQLTVTDATYASFPNAAYKVTEAIMACNSTPAITQITSNVVKLTPAGINRLSANAIRLYPNPATGLVYIDLTGFEACGIDIYNQIGEKVKQIIPGNSGLNAINISSLRAGIYFVSVRSDYEVVSKTLVVMGK